MVSDSVTVPVSYVTALLEQAEERGCDVQQLLAEEGLSPSEIPQQGDFSAVRYGRLYQRLMWLVQDECFGMLSGGQVPIGAFRLMCLAVLHCKNLEEAQYRLAQFCEICRGFTVKGQLLRDAEKAQIRIAPISLISEQQFHQLIDNTSPSIIRNTLAVWHRLHCWLVGQEIPLAALYFSFPCPDEFKTFAESYPGKLLFDQEFNGFEYQAHYLDYPLVQSEETLADFVRTAPYQLVISDRRKQDLKTRVKAMLSRDVSRAMPSADEVAKGLAMSVTTLRRRLQQEETSYQRLKDECRMEAAFHYLNCPELSNSSVAELLGFDEVSAFFRAFKKWTGVTPGDYRRGQS